MTEQPDFIKNMLETEQHHGHEIVNINGRLRWKEYPVVSQIVDDCHLNKIIILFLILGIRKNSEAYRKLYRYMGYSLNGYWKVFYCSINNPKAHKYKPNKK